MTIDVAAFRQLSDGTISNTLADENVSGEEVSGPRKLAQRFALKLLTRKGSMRYKPNEGSSFVGNIVGGRASTELDVFTSFAAALVDISASMSAEESTTDPDDERFQSAVLKNLTIAPGQISLVVQIKSLAGGVTLITLPLRLNLR